MVAANCRSCGRGLRALMFSAWALGLLGSGAGCAMLSDSQNTQGVRMFEQAYYQGALQHFQQAVQTDPNNPDAYYNLARTYHQLGKLHNQPSDLQQAESYYHQCLDHNPDHQDCYRGLAVLLVEQNRRDDAFKLVQNWAARNPSSPAPKVELARLYQESGNTLVVRLLYSLSYSVKSRFGFFSVTVPVITYVSVPTITPFPSTYGTFQNSL